MTNKEAIKILEEMPIASNVHFEEIAETIGIAIKALRNERPHGKWIIDGHHIRCNRCNEYTCDTDREGDKIPNNFCPNCGADMREADNV